MFLGVLRHEAVLPLWLLLLFLGMNERLLSIALLEQERL